MFGNSPPPVLGDEAPELVGAVGRQVVLLGLPHGDVDPAVPGARCDGSMKRSETKPGWARKYALVSVHIRSKTSSRPSGTVKQLISVTGRSRLPDAAAVRASGVMLSIIARSLAFVRCTLV